MWFRIHYSHFAKLKIAWIYLQSYVKNGCVWAVSASLLLWLRVTFPDNNKQERNGFARWQVCGQWQTELFVWPTGHLACRLHFIEMLCQRLSSCHPYIHTRSEQWTTYLDTYMYLDPLILGEQRLPALLATRNLLTQVSKRVCAILALARVWLVIGLYSAGSGSEQTALSDLEDESIIQSPNWDLRNI